MDKKSQVNSDKQKNTDTWKEKLLHWALFSVVIALAPFAIQALMMFTQGNIPTLVVLFSNGQLLVVSSAITAGAIGNLFATKREYKNRKTFVGWCSIIILLLASAWFGIISIESGKPTFNANFASIGSIVMFFFAVISSAGCIVLAEINE